MCTLIAAVGLYPDHPLVVAGNRDEKLDRPADGPGVLSQDPLVVGPRDRAAGGSWIAVNAHGLMVALTNRFTGAPPDPARRSRGALVLEAARSASAEEVHARLFNLAPDLYNPFHLFYADRKGAFLTAADGRRVWRRALGPGLHVITERSDGAEPSPRIALVRELWREFSSGTPEPGALHEMLGRHDPADPSRALCVHLEELGYGTRSTTLVYAPAQGGLALWHAEGPAHASRLERQVALERALAW